MIASDDATTVAAATGRCLLAAGAADLSGLPVKMIQLSAAERALYGTSGPAR